MAVIFLRLPDDLAHWLDDHAYILRKRNVQALLVEMCQAMRRVAGEYPTLPEEQEIVCVPVLVPKPVEEKRSMSPVHPPARNGRRHRRPSRH